MALSWVLPERMSNHRRESNWRARRLKLGDPASSEAKTPLLGRPSLAFCNTSADIRSFVLVSPRSAA